MHTILTEVELSTYKRAVNGEVSFIGWGIRPHYHFDRWQELWPIAFFVDSNIHLWDAVVDGHTTYNPLVLEKYDPERYAVLNYYLADIVETYVKRVSNMPCLPPLTLQHALREVELGAKGFMPKPYTATKPMPQETWQVLSEKLIPLISTYPNPKALKNARKLYSLLGTYNWTDFVAGIAQSIKPKDPKINTVALITNSLYPGGAERQIVNCAIGFKNLGWETHMIAVLGDQAAPHYLQLLHDKNIPFQYIAEGITGTNSLAVTQEILASLPDEVKLALWHLPREIVFQTALLIRQFQQTKPRLVIAYLDWANAIGAMAAVLSGVPEIIISGRNYPPQYFPHFFEKTHEVFYNIYQVLLHCPRVRFTNNAPDAGDAYAKWLGVEADRIKFVPNCLSDSFITQPKAERLDRVRAQYGFSAKDKIVLGVFRLAKEKRPDKFVNVLAKLIKADKNVKGIICGIGPLLPELQEQAQKLKISDKIVFAGLCNTVPELMNIATIMLHTAAFEGMPNVMIEAQSQALPIVCTKSGGVIDCLASDLHSYAFEQEDWDGVTKAATKLLKQPSLRKRLGEAARAHIRKEFAITKLVKRYLDLTPFAKATTKHMTSRKR